MKTIPGFENYAITKTGKVWSKKRKNPIGKQCGGKWLKQANVSRGYLAVELFENGKGTMCLIHRLVLQTYKGRCPTNKECRHLDGNPQNNSLDNLCWGTKSENSYDALRHGAHPGLKNKGENHGMVKLTERDVRMIIYMHNTGLFSQREIAEQYNITRQTISDITTKKSWKHLWAS